MKKWTIAALAALIALSVACMLDVQEGAFVFSDDRLGVGGFPRIVGSLLAIASVINLIYTMFDLKKKGEVSLSGQVDLRTTMAMVLAIAYIFGVINVGFVVSTFFFLLFLTLLFDKMKLTHIKGTLIYSFGVTLVAYYFFKFFKVYLPDTVLF